MYIPLFYQIRWVKLASSDTIQQKQATFEGFYSSKSTSKVRVREDLKIEEYVQPVQWVRFLQSKTFLFAE